MKFTIIVAAYNVADYLEECVDSLAKQNFHPADFEVLIIDDGSTDKKTSSICDQLSSKYDTVRVIHQENGGLSAARNTGIKNAKGKYLLFVDGDDFWSNLNFLSFLSENIDTYQSDVVIFSYDKYYGQEDHINVNFDKVTQFGDIERNAEELVVNEVLTAPAWNKCIKRDIFDKGLVFPLGFLSEDCLYCADVLKNSKTYSILNTKSYMYRQNREGSITNIVKEKNVLDILKSIDIGLDNTEKLSQNIRNALTTYFTISYISIIPYAGQYFSNEEIKQLLKKYKYLLNNSASIQNRLFMLTGIFTKLFGINLSTRLFAFLLRFYK